MRRQRRKRRPDEPKFISTLAHFNGSCGICSRSFCIGARIYWCPKTDTTPTMRVHQFCYLHRTGSYAPSDPSRPTYGWDRQDKAFPLSEQPTAAPGTFND